MSRMVQMSETATSAQTTGVPKQAAPILATLILVAAVANLNLAVANVALPDIGEAFDASQTALDMVAIGYSLGLAGSVLWLGALGDRYGRKRMVLLGMGLSIPACLVAAWAPSIGVLVVARIVGGVSAGMAFPDDARAHHRALGARRQPNESHRHVVGDRRRILRARPVGVGTAPRALLVGIGVPPDASTGRPRAGARRAVPSGPRQRVDRSGRQPRRSTVDAGGGLPRAGHQLRARPDGAGRRTRDARRRGDLRHLLLPASASGDVPAVRPRRGRPSTVLGRRARRHHRVRLADGRHVHRPAVPAERARLRHARSRRGHPARRVHDDPGRAAVGQARAVARLPVHAVARLRLLPRSGSWRCWCCGTKASATGPSHWRTR